MDLTNHVWRSIFSWSVYFDVVDERFILQISQSTDCFLKQKNARQGSWASQTKKEEIEIKVYVGGCSIYFDLNQYI